MLLTFLLGSSVSEKVMLKGSVALREMKPSWKARIENLPEFGLGRVGRKMYDLLLYLSWIFSCRRIPILGGVPKVNLKAFPCSPTSPNSLLPLPTAPYLSPNPPLPVPTTRSHSQPTPKSDRTTPQLKFV